MGYDNSSIPYFPISSACSGSANRGDGIRTTTIKTIIKNPSKEPKEPKESKESIKKPINAIYPLPKQDHANSLRRYMKRIRSNQYKNKVSVFHPTEYPFAKLITQLPLRDPHLYQTLSSYEWMFDKIIDAILGIISQSKSQTNYQSYSTLPPIFPLLYRLTKGLVVQLRNASLCDYYIPLPVKLQLFRIIELVYLQSPPSIQIKWWSKFRVKDLVVYLLQYHPTDPSMLEYAARYRTVNHLPTNKAEEIHYEAWCVIQQHFFIHCSNANYDAHNNTNHNTLYVMVGDDRDAQGDGMDNVEAVSSKAINGTNNLESTAVDVVDAADSSSDVKASGMEMEVDG